MVADVKITANTIDVSNYIKRVAKAIPSDIQKGLTQASLFGIQQITDKTQKGQMPDGGRFRPYSKAARKDRAKRGRQISFVDLTDTGRMFRSLTNKVTKNKATLFFRRQEENKKAFFHDTGHGKMPQRPFFAIARRDEDKIRKIFFRAIKL
jgi:phage gpG-like protein